jgi:DNA-binding GntR family transcriptional regulator
MMPLANSPSLIDQVYQRLLEAISDCTLAPGARIRQGQLAEQLGVSRQPVSHALHLLKRQGLVEESGRKGFQVTSFDAGHIRQLYQVRSALDGLAARLAATRSGSDAAGRAALERALAGGQAITAETALPVLIRLDVDFHQTLYRLAGNTVIGDMIGPHWPHFSRAMAVVLAAPDYRTRAWIEHAAITERILAGDAEGAAEAARDHAIEAGRTTDERLSEAADAA